MPIIKPFNCHCVPPAINPYPIYTDRCEVCAPLTPIRMSVNVIMPTHESFWACPEQHATTFICHWIQGTTDCTWESTEKPLCLNPSTKTCTIATGTNANNRPRLKLTITPLGPFIIRYLARLTWYGTYETFGTDKYELNFKFDRSEDGMTCLDFVQTNTILANPTTGQFYIQSGAPLVNPCTEPDIRPFPCVPDVGDPISGTHINTSNSYCIIGPAL